MVIKSYVYPDQREQTRANPGNTGHVITLVSCRFSQFINHSWGTNLSVVGHGTKELQLQVQSTRDLVKKQPQAAGQVLSKQDQRSFSFDTFNVYLK